MPHCSRNLPLGEHHHCKVVCMVVLPVPGPSCPAFLTSVNYNFVIQWYVRTIGGHRGVVQISYCDRGYSQIVRVGRSTKSQGGPRNLCEYYPRLLSLRLA